MHRNTEFSLNHEVAEASAQELSAEALDAVGGGFLDTWKERIAFTVSPAIYTGAYVYGRWIDD